MKSGRWKWRAMDAEENQKQVFLRVHNPWKPQKARFPHSHRPDDNAGWKSGNPKAGFPLSHRLGFPIQRPKKGGLAAGRFAPASPGSLWDEKMLVSAVHQPLTNAILEPRIVAAKIQSPFTEAA